MKLHTTNEKILGNNTEKATSFSITPSAKAFQILSSGIYKHKIRAIVRETVCNANDAHIASGQTEQKWVVKAPTQLDPRFVVRDFGKGLDHEDMTTIYTRYFESTKGDDDKQTGAFGLGAKSPFSYTDTFTVASYHDNVCRIYNACLANGEPQLIKVFEGPFNEDDRSGLEVTIPVKEEDISRWESEILLMMRPFDPETYEIKGITTDVKSFKSLENYSDDWFYLSDRNYVNGHVYVIYGNIVYDVTNTPGLDAGWLQAKTTQSTFVHIGLETLLAPQPSREELQFDDFTVGNICNRINTLSFSVMEKDIESLKDITNPRELIRRLWEMPSQQRDVLYANTAIKFLGETKTYADTLKLINFDSLVQYSDRLSVYECCEENPLARTLVTEAKRSYKRVTQISDQYLFDYKKRKAFVIIHDDSKKGIIRQTIRGLTLAKDSITPTRADYIIVIRDNDPDTLKVIQDMMVGDEVHVFRASECEDYRKLIPNYGVKRKSVKSDRPKAPNATHFYYDNEGVRCSKDMFLSTDDIAELKGFVVGLQSQDIRIKSASWSPVINLTVYKLSDWLHSTKISDSLYIVRPGVFRRASMNDNLKCAADVLTKYILGYVSKMPPRAFGVSDRNDIIRSVLRLNSHNSRYLCDLLHIANIDQPHVKTLVNMMKEFHHVRSYGTWANTGVLPALVQAKKLYNENTQKSLECYTKAIKVLEETQPLVHHALNSGNFGKNDHVVNDQISKLLAIKLTEF